MIGSFLQYTHLIHISPEIESAQTHYFRQFFANQPVHNAKDQLNYTIHHALLKKKMLQQNFIEKIGQNVIWNEQNLNFLNKALVQFLQNLETDLIGCNLIQKIHWNYIKAALEIHLKNYLNLVFSNLHRDEIPLTPDEDLQFALEIKNLFFWNRIRNIIFSIAFFFVPLLFIYLSRVIY